MASIPALLIAPGTGDATTGPVLNPDPGPSIEREYGSALNAAAMVESGTFDKETRINENAKYNHSASRYSIMRRMIFFTIVFVSLCVIAGCISPTTNSPPMTGPSPPNPGDPSAQYGGSALAIAFRADEISTTSPEAREHFIKGLTYSTQYARYNDSLAFFDAALSIDRNFSEAWIAKGVALHNMKRYDEAIKNYDRALEINPRDAGTWSVKAITLRDWGKLEEAAECNRQAAELDPGYRNPYGAAVPLAQPQSFQ